MRIEKANPLFQEINYAGQTYFSLQYFHKLYPGQQFKQFKNFSRMVKNIPAYPDYLESGDIVEIDWKAGSILEPALEPLRKQLRGNPLTLLNAVAQVAMTHHLDDENSRMMSVAVNTQAVTSELSDTVAQVAATKKIIATLVELGGVLGVDPNIGRASAVEMARRATGFDAGLLLAGDAAPKTLHTPTELGAKLGGIGARQVNKLLAAAGLQVKVNGDWKATERGREYSSPVAFKSRTSAKEGYTLKWYESVLSVIS